MPQSFIADQMGCSRYKAKPKAGVLMATDPFQLFDRWFAEARANEPNEPEAMALATTGMDLKPSVRMVLLKAHGPEGFTFYTHDASRKGKDLAQNPRAALLFHWKSLCRQVRIEGEIELVSGAAADAYFATRARDSQLGAWASDQSRPLDSRATFEKRFEEAKQRFEGRDVPRPAGWRGYRVVPERIEFWTAREHRLHERQLFTRSGAGWSVGLLYP
jgi:pyridoxamine 5'-phosphate oxidase